MATEPDFVRGLLVAIVSAARRHLRAISIVGKT